METATQKRNQIVAINHFESQGKEAFEVTVLHDRFKPIHKSVMPFVKKQADKIIATCYPKNTKLWDMKYIDYSPLAPATGDRDVVGRVYRFTSK